MNDGELTQVLERVESIEASIGQLQRSVARVLRRLDNAAPRLHTATFNSIEALIAVYHQLGSSATLPPLAGPFGGWSITPDMARVVCDLFTVYKPSQVLDLGSGTSTVLMGHLLKETPGARIVSLEHDAVWYAQTLEAIHRSGLEEVVELRFAPLTPIALGSASFQWYSPDAATDLENLDVVLVDGPPQSVGPRSRYPAAAMVIEKCRPGCLFIVDDTVRQEEREMVDLWRAETGLQLLDDYRWHSKGASILQVPPGDRADG